MITNTGVVAAEQLSQNLPSAREQSVLNHGFVITGCGGDGDAEHCEHDNKLSALSHQPSGKSISLSSHARPDSRGAAVPTYSSLGGSHMWSADRL